MKDIRILGIETSCDETAAAVISLEGDDLQVASHLVNSQVNLHATFGGVIPEVAARQHIKNILPLIDEAMQSAKVNFKDIDALAVTKGPGLAGALMVGLETAKTLAWLHHKPLYQANHLLGHLWSWLLPLVGQEKKMNIEFPFLSLIVSGGHTELVVVKDYAEYEVVGRTLDDAAGEAFDKVAKILELGYPGGPILSKRAELGDDNSFIFPRPMLADKNFDFSFSGLKTSVLYAYKKQTKVDDVLINNIAASFQRAAVDVLVKKTIKAAQFYKVKAVTVVGGVSANALLRAQFKKYLEQIQMPLFLPELTYTGDNAAMIALAGYMVYNKRNMNLSDQLIASAQPNFSI
jgi:N6-L-threonylcarbamoyladenine synthase